MDDPKATALAIQQYAHANKPAYTTELAARRAARFARKEHGQRLVVYRCTEPGCKLWHLIEKDVSDE